MVACMDEVGRGAISGPATVGVVAVTLDTPSAPSGVRDSKLLTPSARNMLVPRIVRWAPGFGVGHVTPAEIDAVGILPGLRMAGLRALESLAALGWEPDLVLLDGNHDWLTDQGHQASLFDAAALGAVSGVPTRIAPQVVTKVKADMTCSAVAAASVLAKVERDAVMVSLARDFPHYGWDVNKGYATPEHQASLRQHGLSEHHRRSWNLRAVAQWEEAAG